MCRGLCAPLGSNPGEGVCASLLDLSRTRTCPDRPDRIHVVGNRARDNLGVCALLRCTSDADCTAPLRCLPNGTGSICNYPRM